MTSRRLNRGQRITGIKADTWNSFVDAAEDFERRKLGQVGAPRLLEAAVDPSIVLVKNSSGADVDRFNVLGINAPLITQANNPIEFYTRAAFIGAGPNSVSYRGKFCVTLEPIANGKIGRAVVDGVIQCQIDLKNTGDRFADITLNDPTKLTSGPSGSARILHVVASVGVQWGIVRLADPRVHDYPVSTTNYLSDTTWTVPNGVSRAIWILVSGGGGGGSGAAGESIDLVDSNGDTATLTRNGNSGGGGSGGPGAYVMVSGLIPGTQYDLVIGAGGAANSSGGRTEIKLSGVTIARSDTSLQGGGADANDAGLGGGGQLNYSGPVLTATDATGAVWRGWNVAPMAGTNGITGTWPSGSITPGGTGGVSAFPFGANGIGGNGGNGGSGTGAGGTGGSGTSGVARVFYRAD